MNTSTMKTKTISSILSILLIGSVAMLSTFSVASSKNDAQTQQRDGGGQQRVSPAPARGTLVDINTATAVSLENLKGIGPARAADIIKNRPYTAKDELVSKNILTQAIYDEIKDQVIAKRATVVQPPKKTQEQ
jgi:competence protein ComEA